MRIGSSPPIDPSGSYRSRSPAVITDERVNPEVMPQTSHTVTTQMQLADEKVRIVPEHSPIPKDMRVYQQIESFGDSESDVVMLDIRV